MCSLFVYTSLDYIIAAWSIRETSRNAGGLPYPFILLLKSTLLIMPVAIALQGSTIAISENHQGKLTVEWGALLLFVSVIVLLLAGFPVAFSLSGTALIFACIGVLGGGFEIAFLSALPSRIFGIMNNETLVAVPLFVFIGVTLERARIAEDFLETMSSLFGSLRSGLGISVTLIGMLLTASTGIVGATVVTMGLLALPTMLNRGYSAEIAPGTICASGTLGQIIPPSIIFW
jgi:TRAP-type mannitol/chloroaromatic compound transport system permease large subunit